MRHYLQERSEVANKHAAAVGQFSASTNVHQGPNDTRERMRPNGDAPPPSILLVGACLCFDDSLTRLDTTDLVWVLAAGRQMRRAGSLR